MELDFFIYSFLELLSGFSAIMIGFLFLTVRSKNQLANIFLVLFLWCLAWVILTSVLSDYLEENRMDMPMFLEFDPVLLIIPSLFIYIIITLNTSFNAWYLLLFLPGIIINIFQFPEDSIIDIIFMLLFPLINLPLMIIAYRILSKHRKKVTHYYSELEYKTLTWIKSIIITVLLLHFFVIFGGIIEELSFLAGDLFFILEGLTTLFIVYWVGYNGFFQAQLFSENTTNSNESLIAEQVTSEIGIKKDVVVDKESIARFKEIEDKIKAERIFQNSNLNLRILASELGIKEKELSKLINQCSNTNFYQFINRFRVDEFKNLLESPKAKQMSILGLAQEAGFSSKSTFYTAFKTLEGVTPKQYELALNASE